MNYCRYSAMPVGRFVLDVHGEPRSTWPANDALCAALQIINHLQDCAADYRDLDRVYLPLDLLGALRRQRRAAQGAGRLAAIARLPQRYLRAPDRAAEGQARRFPPRSPTAGLSLEVAVIQRLAEKLTRMLRAHDPLSERVHLGHAGSRRRRRARRRAGRLAPLHQAEVDRPRGQQQRARRRRRHHRLRQLVLRRHAHPAARAAPGHVRHLRLLPRGRRHRRRRRRPRRAARAARAMAARHRRDLCRPAAGAARKPGAGGARLRPARARISSPSSTAWRWTCAPTSARPISPRSIFIATASRQRRRAAVACACSA